MIILGVTGSVGMGKTEAGKYFMKNNIDVLLDDIDENLANKFKKHDLLGIPFQIIIGSKSQDDEFEFKEI